MAGNLREEVDEHGATILGTPQRRMRSNYVAKKVNPEHRGSTVQEAGWDAYVSASGDGRKERKGARKKKMFGSHSQKGGLGGSGPH